MGKDTEKKVEKKDAVKIKRGLYYERQKIDIFRKEYRIDSVINTYKKSYKKDIEKLFSPLYEDENNYVFFEQDYSYCYYDGETPDIKLVFGNDKKRWETDKEYKKRCRQEPYDGMKIRDTEQFVMDNKEDN